MSYIFRIIAIAVRYKYRLIAAYLCTAGAIVAYVALPKLFGQAIDKIVQPLMEGREVEIGAILAPVAIIMLLGVVRGALSYGQTFLAESLSQYVSYDIRNSFYNHIQHQSFSFHDRYHTGNLMSRAITDVENVRMFINMGLVRAPYFVMLFFVVGAILIISDWKLGLLSASFMPVVALYTSHVRLRMRALWLQVQEKMAELSTILQENFSGMRLVKSFASESFEEEKFNVKSAEVSDIYVRAERLRASSTSFMLFTFLVAIGLILWFGGSQVIEWHNDPERLAGMSPGQLAEFIFYLQILAMPVRMAGWLVNSYARAASAGERLFEILDHESVVKEIEQPIVMDTCGGYVRFEHVSFTYDGSKNVLEDISIEAKPGKTIALIGPPGSGKSSVIGLLPRFYDPTNGVITIDGKDIRDFTLKSLRSHVGVVQQDVFLFTASIAENIAYGNEHATSEEISNSAKVAQMSDYIESLDEGYETIIGERGSTLSGGQRQRMAIARAVLLDPPILVLDDSTSSVDAQTEDDIRVAMESLVEGRTVFIIANRISTVRKADLIIVLEKGRILEQGTHQELLDRDGSYRKLYELQLRPQTEIFKEFENGD